VTDVGSVKEASLRSGADCHSGGRHSWIHPMRCEKRCRRGRRGDLLKIDLRGDAQRGDEPGALVKVEEFWKELGGAPLRSRRSCTTNRGRSSHLPHWLRRSWN